MIVVPTLRSRRTPIGIDVGGRSINAVQLSRAGSPWRVEAATSIQRPDAGAPVTVDDARRLARVLERQGFSGRDIVLAVPHERLLTAMVELPPAESVPLREQICRVEIAGAHRCDPSSIELAFWELPSGGKGGSVTAMAVGCRHDHANELLDTFETAGFTVCGLDVQAWALTRAVRPMLDDVRQFAAILDAGWSDATLIIALDGVVVFERVLADCGLNRLHRTVLDDLGLDADVVDYLLSDSNLDGEADDAAQQELIAAVRDRIETHVAQLATEIRLSLSYATKEYRREGADRLIVVGSAASVPGLADDLGAACEVKAGVVAPTHLAECTPRAASRCASPALTAAFGLAQHGKGRDR